MCVCVCDSFFLLSLFVTLYIFLHLTVMHSSTFGKGWVGMSACPLVVLACESLHVCTVCIWHCEHARFCVEVFYALYINFHSFQTTTTTTTTNKEGRAEGGRSGGRSTKMASAVQQRVLFWIPFPDESVELE